MEQPNRAIYWGLVLSTSLLAKSFPSSIAYDRPIHAIVLLSFAIGVVLIASRRSLSPLFRHSQQSLQGGANLPLEEATASSSFEDINHNRVLRGQRTTPWVLLARAVLSLVVRIELLRRILKATECTISSPEVFVPLVLAVYDGLRRQRWRSRSHRDVSDLGVYGTVYKSSGLHWFLDSRFRYVFPTFLVTLGCHLASGLWSGVSSTYICPLVVGQTRTVPLMQLVAAALDCHLAITAYGLCLQKPGRPVKGGASILLWWGFILLAASALWTVIVFLANPEYSGWLVQILLLFDPAHVFALLWQFVLFATLCICSAHCIIYLGVLELVLTSMTICVVISSISFLWANRGPFPPVSHVASFWSFFLVLGGFLCFQHLRQPPAVARSFGTPTYLLIFSVFLIALYPAFSRPNVGYFHPIDMLIYRAKSQHEDYESYATQSYNLEEAAAQYRRRYRKTPPPAFDSWYLYAIDRGSIIVDQYDQIHNDMLPYWSISPAQLRQSTWELISNPWNDVGGIQIRAGIATVVENVPGTHRWMLEGVSAMINKFAKYLPDMDLAFNLNDEARVAVPYAQIKHLRRSPNVAEDLSGQRSSWSKNRADGWPPIKEEPYTQTILQDRASQNTFLDFGSGHCDPSSPARSTRDLYSRSHLCLACMSPHSLGQFLSNWTLSGDVCHQPDMASLHGFYLSPAAFRGSHTLVPIFSQSKPYGFNDILYPSAWNYMDKVVYAPTERSGAPGTKVYDPGHPDPPFEAKQNTLFWRGATSEGVSSGDHTWRGMTRQRLVHLANNLTSSAHDTITILLPHDSGQGRRYRYINLAGNAVRDLGLSTDIAIVDNIARCGGIGLHDCKDQEAEFGLVGPADFQSHWQYRYLFDLDGAGFSGRFLAFLQSHSLPFKSALFREWYDERMTAWHHFVPQDIRLHAVWSTLAYFAGVNATLPGGRRFEMAAHVKEGERIAEQGREWAGKVLRKEDMEVYFFRVLLEWGRLTDDNREAMGFVPGRESRGSA